MGLSAQDVCPDPLPEMLPPDTQENPMLLFFGEPGARPRRALSCSVTGNVQASEPRSVMSLTHSGETSQRVQKALGLLLQSVVVS